MTATIYTRIGGQPAVTAAVDALYRAILGDDQLAPYFARTDLDQLKSHMIDLLSQVLGGPDGYTGRQLGAAHAGLGITRRHYELVGAYLIGVLAGLGVSDDILDSVRSVLASVATDIITS